MLSLAIIAKNEKEQVERIVKEYGKYFGEIVVGADEPIEVDGATVHLYEQSEEEKQFGGIFFDRKRNWLAEKVNGDYYFRLDTDDVIVGVENIKDVYEKAQELRIDVVCCYYDYGRDEWGNTHAAHYRETIIRKTKDVFWNKHIHENIIPRDGYQNKLVEDDFIKIFHNIDSKPDEERNARNLKYLVYEFNKDRENTDPRTLAYLGRMLIRLDPEKAKFFLKKHIEKSGWDEDRLLSWMYLAEVYIEDGDIDQAITCCIEAMLDKPDVPEPFLKLHDIYFQAGDWAKAIIWGEKGLKTKAPKTLMVRDPSGRTWRPLVSMAICLFNVNRLEEAMAFLQKAKQFVPDNQTVLDNEKIFAEAIKMNDFKQAFKVVYNYMAKHNTSVCKDLVSFVPKSFLRDPYFSELILTHTQVRVWGNDEVAIFCGRSPEEWCPLSVNKGIGGSEEAVIRLAEALQKQGKKVTVFCECGELEGEYSGVVYKDTVRFNPKDSFNFLIAWRGNVFDFVQLEARRKIVWLHDMPQAEQFKELNYENGSRKFCFVVVLSKYHKSLLPNNVADEKIFVSTNGLVPKDFKNLKVERQKGRVIYASSYDRGLEKLLKDWPKVKQAVPHAELHIYYGWNTYDKFVELGGRTTEYKDYMVGLMNQPGVFDHGRVGHKELLKEYCKAEVFSYPTDFAGEINCIALSKAIATGCRCVTNDYAVLKERNPDVVATNEEFADKLIEVLKTENTNGINHEYIEKMSWDNVAKDWCENILVLEKNKYKDLEEYKDYYIVKDEWKAPNLTSNGDFLFPPRFDYVIDKMKELGVKEHLDVGCCDGTLNFFTAERLGIQSDGLEIDSRATEWSQKFADGRGLKCKFFTGTIEEFAPEKKYDAVSCLEVIEHVLKPKEILDKLESYVKDGGYIFLSTPEKNGPFGDCNFNPQHIHSFDKESIEALIGKERIVDMKIDELINVVYRK